MRRLGERRFAWATDAPLEAVRFLTGSGDSWTYAQSQKARLAPTIFVVLTTIGIIAYHRGPLGSDVSGQFWLARAMRHGMRLYVDFVEINPPLWFWMAMPLDWFAENFGVRPEPMTIAIIGLLVLASMHATRRVLTRGDVQPSPAFLIYMAAILLIMPLQNLEQREHLALIGAIPYLALAAARRQGHAVNSPLAMMIGLGAAMGLLLKPYFLAVPVLTEAWLLISLRGNWRPVRSETVAFASAGALYAAAVALISPEYLTHIVPQVLPLYEAATPPIIDALGIFPLILLCMLLGVLAYWRAIRLGATPVAVAFLLGFAGFGFSYLVQHKGWLYQGLPAAGCLALALAAVVAEAGRPVGRLRLFLPALLVWPLSFSLLESEPKMTGIRDISPAIADLREGDGLGLISVIGATSWPATVNRGLRSPSRYGSYWILVAVDAHPHDPAVQHAGRQVGRNTALDYRCLPPKVIIFTRFDRRPGKVPARYDPYRYFMQIPEFASVLSHYRLSKSYGMFDVYRQAKPLERPIGHECRHPG